MKQSVIEKGTGKIYDDQIRCKLYFKRIKVELFSEKEKSRRMNLELARFKYELERTNKWTQSSMILTQLSNRTYSAKTGISFVKKHLRKPLIYVHTLVTLVTQEVPFQ